MVAKVVGKHGTMAEAAGEVPVWVDPADSDGVPLWKEFRGCVEDECDDPDCDGCEPWYDSGPTIYDRMEWQDERERAEEFGANMGQPLTDQEADAAQDWRGTPEVSREKWNIRPWRCPVCLRYFLRSGWWNRYHKVGDTLTRDAKDDDHYSREAYQREPWCGGLGVELTEGPVYAAWLIGGPDAVAAMVAR